MAYNPQNANGQAVMANSAPVVIASNQSVIPVNDIGASTSGTISALNGAVTLNCGGDAGAAIDLRGTFTATVTFQGTIDGTTFFNLVATPVAAAANVAVVSTATAAGAWYVQCAGCTQVRAIATAYTSGTITAVLRAVTSPPWVYQAPVGATNAMTISSGTVTTVSTVSNVAAIAAGANAIGDLGVQYRANATGAAGIISVMSPSTPAAATIKATAGRLIGWQLQNSSAGVRSVKLFNVAVPTLGTTSAAMEIDIPAGGRSEIQLPGGIGFATAITYSVTSAKGLTDNTATGLAANDVSGAFFFA